MAHHPQFALKLLETIIIAVFSNLWRLEHRNLTRPMGVDLQALIVSFTMLTSIMQQMHRQVCLIEHSKPSI